MRAILLAVLLGQSPDSTPDVLWRTALADLRQNVPIDRHHTTRYLDIHVDPPRLIRALAFATNATAFRSTFARHTLVGTNLLRIDLADLGWDRGSRVERLKDLERRGVDFALKDAEARRLFLDPWEQFSRDDPYFLVTQYHGGKLVRGWIDPRDEALARQLSFSTKFVVRGDWLLGRLLTERQFGGYYSTLLMLPPKEADLYKVFGVDISLVDAAENKLRRGGAVLSSIVALHNRELQEIPSLYGTDFRFIWRTFDVNADDRGKKSVLEAFAGTVKHDGREIIGSLPNGLIWFYLANGAGAQAAVVPEDIAQIKAPLLPVRETRVINGYKCLECHGPSSGLIPFDDVVSKAILNPAVQLSVITDEKRKDSAAATRALLEDYYLSPLGRTIQRQQESFAERLRDCCGMTGLEMASLVVSMTEEYQHDLVSPEQAAREMGMPLKAAQVLWRVSGNSILVVLSGGQPVRRAAFEQSIGDGYRAMVHPWEKH